MRYHVILVFRQCSLAQNLVCVAIGWFQFPITLTQYTTCVYLFCLNKEKSLKFINENASATITTKKWILYYLDGNHALKWLAILKIKSFIPFCLRFCPFLLVLPLPTKINFPEVTRKRGMCIGVLSELDN